MIDDKVLLLKTDCCGKEKLLRSASGAGMKGQVMGYERTGDERHKSFNNSHCHCAGVFCGECNRDRGIVLAYCSEGIPAHDGRGVLSVAGAVSAFCQKHGLEPAYSRHHGS